MPPATTLRSPRRSGKPKTRRSTALPALPAAKSAALARRSAELALAVPQVVAHRLTRMALAGPVPSARDQREFTQMVSEKGVAFQQSWQAMALAGWQAQQSLAAAWWRACTGLAVRPALPVLAAEVLGKGLAPVHRKAVANARRLSRTKLR